MDDIPASDEARHAVVDQLLAMLGNEKGRLQAAARTLEPIRIVLHVEGMPARLVCIPASVTPGVAARARNAGQGIPRIDLYIGEEAGLDWLPGRFSHRGACDVEQLMRVIRRWRDIALPARPLQAQPLTAADLRPLRAVATARQTVLQAAACVPQSGSAQEREAHWKALGLVTEVDPAQQAPFLIEQAYEQLVADLAHLDPVQLLANAPRDERGRLALDSAMLLATYPTREPQRSIYKPWLAAFTPLRRRDPQVVTLRLEPLIGENHPHRWDAAPWLWDGRASGASEDVRWGVPDLSVADLGLEGRDRHIAELEQRCTLRQARLCDRVALCILLQDAGRVEEALALCGVEMEPEVTATLRGTRPSLSGGMLTESWARFLQEQLRSAAPWRFQAVLANEIARRRAWAAAKRGRRVQPPRLRLFALPNQPWQSKSSLILVGSGLDHSVPRLEIESTSANGRLPEPLWRRPLDLDLARFGLI